MDSNTMDENRSKVTMDEVENQQHLHSKIDFDTDKYKTDFVAYDMQEHEMVTAYDAMFGKSKGHDVIELSKAVDQIRGDLDSSIVKGHLNGDHTESVLIDIRQALNTCDQAKNKALREADGAIKDLIKTLYERKDKIIEEISNHFNEQRQKIESQENKWREKQNIYKNLLELTSNKEDDQALLQNSKYVAEGIDSLSEPAKFEQFELINSLDTVMHVIDEEKGIKKADISHEELKRLIMSYIGFNEFKKIQYKC